MFDAHDPSQPDGAPFGVDLTPMIDVTFLLIIFWLVVTSLSPAEPLKRLELPAASVSQPAGAGRPLVLDVTGEPVRPIYLAGQALSLEELDQRLAERPLAGRKVVLRADRRADSALVSRLARVCYRHQAGSVAFSLQAVGPAGSGSP